MSFPASVFALIICLLIGLGGIARRLARRKRPPLPSLIGFLLAGLALYVPNVWLTWFTVFFFLFAVAVPVFIGLRALRFLQYGELEKASRWAGVRGLFNRRWADLSTVWSLAADHYAGRPAPAQIALAEWTAHGDSGSMLRRDGLSMLLGAWDGLCYSSVLDYRVRALCESGSVSEAALEFAAAWQGHSGVRRTLALRRAALPLLAFTGRVAATRQLTDLMGIPEPTKAYWVYTSRLTSGDHVDPVPRTSQPGFLAERWQRRVLNPPATARLERSTEAILDEVIAEIECAVQLRPSPFWTYPVVTTMLGVCVCGFVLQLLRGGVHDTMTALSLGALLAEGQFPAEPWRLVAYAFIHFGPLHLGTNMGVLAMVGPVVARHYGQIGFLIITLMGIVIAGLSISFLGEPGVTVGASGGTMALVGALMLYVLGAPEVRRSRWGRFVGMCLVALIALEVVADLVVPEISFAGHAGGFLGGLIMGALWRSVKSLPWSPPWDTDP